MLPTQACYNLGTVLYGHACSLQEALLAGQEAAEAAALAALAARSRAGMPQTPRTPRTPRSTAAVARERAIAATFAHAAQYIALAAAQQPGKQVYSDSLAAVQRLLPLPFLRAGPLMAVHPDTAGTPAERWSPAWFGLDSERLAAARPPAALAGQAAAAGLPLASVPPPIVVSCVPV